MSLARLELESADAAEALLDTYRAETHDWGFPRIGEFWEAVREAHRRGYTGKGMRAAVVDGAFDLERVRLAIASGGTVRMPGRFGEPTAHGTLVALLLLTVAPDAALDLYEVTTDGTPDPFAVAEALSKVCASDATSVCLSLGADQPFQNMVLNGAGPKDVRPSGWKWQPTGENWLGVRPEACMLKPCLCEAVTQAAGPGRAVMVAGGNKAMSFSCPAIASAAIAIGFQQTIRERTSNGSELAEAGQPSGFSQSLLPDMMLNQPHGALGTSFAAPLAAGAALLGLETADLPAMVAAAHRSTMSHVHLQTALRINQQDAQRDSAMLRGFQAALEEFPHTAGLHDGTHWCIGCALFGTATYINAGMALMLVGNPEVAEPLLRVGRHLAPESPHAAANLAFCLLMLAEKGEGARRLPEAVELYDKAIARRPDFTEYVRARERVLELLDPQGHPTM